MAKTSGLGVRLYAAGYDLNTDVNAISGIGSSQELLDVTPLAKSGRSRIIGVADANLSVNGYFDSATGRSHAAWTSNSNKIQTADQNVIVTMGTSRGDAACGFVAKQGTYNVDRSPGNAIATTVTYDLADGNGLNWGVILTDGPEQTDSSATNSASVDNSASTSNGGTGLISVESLASGTATIKVQHSADNATFADLLTFTNVTGRTSERVSGGTTVNRYVRIQSSGTFSNLVFVAQFARL